MIKARALSWVLAVVGSFAAGVAVRNYMGGTYQVMGNSMTPTLPQNSVVLAQKVGLLTEIHRGDIVIINDGHADLAVKRVIGLPGEWVRIEAGQVWINNRLLPEPYLKSTTTTARCGAYVSCRLGGDEFFVLGDNRAMSVDSRFYGPLRRDQVQARQVTWPRF
jgi:signal peptidase I